MENNRKQYVSTFKTAEVVTLVAITCLVSFFMGTIINNVKGSKSYELIEADMEIQNFIKQYNYIIENYFGEVDKKELLEAALKGMIESLEDPYSKYLDDDLSSTFNATLNGSYEGIGVEIINDVEKNIIVANVFEGSPAAVAGIKPLDIITCIDNKKIGNISTTEFIGMVKELKKPTFSLGVKRGEEDIMMSVTRKKVILSSVSSEIIEKENKKIGYMYISIFASNTDSQFKSQLNDLESSGINSLIIDLRGNSGGHLVTVENMISEFLDNSNIIYQMETKEAKKKYYSKGMKTKEYPIVVLVDNDSASASEMMTAALKEKYGAIVVGEVTYGKGTVQELQNDNENQYKITTKKWLTPDGNWVHEVGIIPDYVVKTDTKYFYARSKEKDGQLQKAIELLVK